MSMKSRKPITLEEHYEMAVALKEADRAVLRALSFNHNYYASENKKLIRATNDLGAIRSRLEDVMFRDFGYLSNDWLRMYFGELEDSTRLIESIRTSADGNSAAD